MSAKDLIIEFLNTVFIIIIIGFFIVFFVAGDRFEQFGKFMESLVPFAVFGILFLVKFSANRYQLKKRTREDNLDIVLYLTYSHKLISDIVVYLLPVAIIAIPMMANGRVDFIDILQAAAALLMIYFWQRFLFKKER